MPDMPSANRPPPPPHRRHPCNQTPIKTQNKRALMSDEVRGFSAQLSVCLKQSYGAQFQFRWGYSRPGWHGGWQGGGVWTKRVRMALTGHLRWPIKDQILLLHPTIYEKSNKMKMGIDYEPLSTLGKAKCTIYPFLIASLKECLAYLSTS